ncbi:MAG: bifunctional diaminohydroxyphosphoribosylaminopyrimidine deaminase/5-amino-6-(5-phosphoribosylamino)uracil reductase RibD [Pseudonocardiaceae bacterium]
MASQIERDAMGRAIALSALGLGATSPNPPVGCVILDAAGHIAGQGYHQRKGEPHAETYALAAAGSRAEGGTGIVTLEPCNHHGRTPPCHQALIDAHIARVVIALIDPTSRGEGGGAKLRMAGIDVEVGVLANEARLVLGPWLNSLKTGRPHLTWAYVHSDDGPAPALGSTSPLIAADARLLRTHNDAVLYTGGEVEEGVPNSHGAGMLNLSSKPLTDDPTTVLAVLYAAGVRSVLLSGGRSLAEPFVQAELVNRIVVYFAVEGPSTSPRSPDISWSLLPSGFEIATITRQNMHVKITGIPSGGVSATGSST